MTSSQLQKHWQIDGIIFRIATEHDLADIAKLLKDEFYPRMPLFLYPPTEIDYESVNFPLALALKHEASLVAIDAVSDELVAARINTIDSADESDSLDFIPSAERLASYERFYLIIDFVRRFESTVDCFKMFNVDKALSFKAIVVKESYSRRGIGKKLNQLAFELASSYGIPLVKGSTEMLYSQRINESLGMQAVHRISYSDYVDPETGDRPFVELGATAHKEAVMFAKLIS